jgi:hypothetical protein
MELRRAGYTVIFVILLCGLSIRGSDAKRTAETLVRNGGSQEPDEEMV